MRKLFAIHVLRIGLSSAAMAVIIVVLYLASGILMAWIMDRDSIVWDGRFYRPAAYVYTWGLSADLTDEPSKWFLFWDWLLYDTPFGVDARTSDYFDLRDRYGRQRSGQIGSGRRQMGSDLD